MHVVEVSLMVRLNEDKIKAHADLDGWMNIINRDSDRFEEWDRGVTWDDIYTAIAVDAFAGGDFTQFVLVTGTDVTFEDDPDPKADTENGPGLDDWSDGITEVAPGVFRVADDDPPSRPATYNGLPLGT